MAFLPILAIFTNFIALGPNFGLPNHFRCLESVIFELSGVENRGVGPKISILVLIVPYILMYGIFTHFRRF